MTPAPDSKTDRDARPVDPGRRRAIDWLLGSWLVGVCGAVFYPVMRFLVPPEISEAPTQSVKAGSAASLSPNTARLVPFGQTPAIVVRLKTGELRAFAGTCTHLSCTVQFRPDPSTSGARVTTGTMT
jgi:Rieske Fe-S protein